MAIAQKIRQSGGDYLLALKGNHPKLAEAVADTFAVRRPWSIENSFTLVAR
jgi:predicted transposase YbfD/YdcC